MRPGFGMRVLEGPEPEPFAQFFEEIATIVDPPAAVSPGQPDERVRIANERELAAWVFEYLGVRIPAKRVCRGHRAPLEAFAAAYFAEHPRIVWKASRGFGGKTVLMAALSMTEAITLGAGVTLLGGSLEQSQRVHQYMQGQENMAGCFWEWPNSPRHLLRSDPTARHTRLSNGGWISALTASTKSVRGPHPQRMRGDEIDEMDEKVWDAAQGQAKAASARQIADQVVGSSTHQYADGTMTRELKMAAERGWPVFEWCYRELEADRIITDAEVKRKKASVTVVMWENEYELQEPEPEGRAIDPTAVERAFDPKRGTFVGAQGETLVFEKPLWELDPDWIKAKPAERDAVRDKLRVRLKCRYAAGADWGKKRDHTVAYVWRMDTHPFRIVAYLNLVRKPYPVMFGEFNALVLRYDAAAAHDATGLGTVAEDYVQGQTVGVALVGAARSTIWSEYIVGLEAFGLVGPRIETAYRAHKFATNDDLYGTGHPPDEFVAAALTYYAATHERALLF